MKQKKKIALTGLAGSFFLSLALIHWLLADLLVRVTGVSRDAATWYAVTLLVLLTLARAVLIILDKDAITNYINKRNS